MSMKVMKERWLCETNLDPELVEHKPPIEENHEHKPPIEENHDHKPPVEENHDHKPDLPAFINIKENAVMCDENLIKECPVVRCFCEPTEEQLQTNQGCGDDCINRMLYTECGSRCPSGASCSNRRLHNQEYAKVEAFYAGVKGWGLRACEELAEGRFVMEYVGDVISAEDMRRRVKRYAKDPSHVHHYLMALKNGAVIDATVRGNISRFINHSCDPNCRSEKWMVDRRVRIGFFAIKPIAIGEELVFDYKLELYGRKAQECYCGADKCRGMIGSGQEQEVVTDDDMVLESDSESEPESEPVVIKKKVAARRKSTKHDIAHIQQAIEQGPPINRSQVKALVQVMIGVERAEHRSSLLSLFTSATPDIIRLLMEECGLRVLYIFLASEYTLDEDMMALTVYDKTLDLLAVMPIKTKNQVVDSHLTVTLNRLLSKQGAIDSQVKDTIDEMLALVCNQTMPSTSCDTTLELLHRQIIHKTNCLLNKWKHLREEFRIPRRERSDTPLSEHEKEEEEYKKHRRSVLLEQVKKADSSYNHRIRPPHHTTKRPFVSAKQDNREPAIRKSRFDVVGPMEEPRVVFEQPTLLPQDMFNMNQPVYPYYYGYDYYNYMDYYNTATIRTQNDNDIMRLLDPPSPPSGPMPDMLKIGEFNLDKITQSDIDSVEQSLSIMKEKLIELNKQQHPPPPPPEQDQKARWMQAITEEGAVYYYNKETRQSAWTLPGLDTASEHGQSRAAFKAVIAKHIAGILEPIRKLKFSSSDDYKYLVRKLTHTVLEKESKRVGEHGVLTASASVKEKATKMIADCMNKLGDGIYSRRHHIHHTY